MLSTSVHNEVFDGPATAEVKCEPTTMELDRLRTAPRTEEALLEAQSPNKSEELLVPRGFMTGGLEKLKMHETCSKASAFEL